MAFCNKSIACYCIYNCRSCTCYFYYYNNEKGISRFKALQNSIDCLNSCVQEGLVNIRLIKSFVRKDYEKAF